MIVLSLFDGISCGQLALNRANISIEKYYASEINIDSVKVTQFHFPSTIQLGDVNNIDFNRFKDIDLLIGGSPCASFSSAGKQSNFKDPRGELFFKFVEALEIIKPKYFLFENVIMKKEWEDKISSYLDCSPLKINSSLVSAQNRIRNYWTNILVDPIEDRYITYQDIIGKDYYPAAVRGRRINTNNTRSDYDKDIPICQYLEWRTDNKSNCLTTVDKDNVAAFFFSKERKKASDYRNSFVPLTVAQYEMLQTLPVGYTSIIKPNNKRKKLIGDGWTVDIIAHIFKNMIL